MDEPKGVKIGGYEFYKGKSGFVVVVPGIKLKIFKAHIFINN